MIIFYKCISIKVTEQNINSIINTFLLKYKKIWNINYIFL